MTTEISTEEAIIRMIEAYGDRTGQWMRITEIAKATGLTAQEIAAAVETLMGDEDFRAEPEPFGWRITDEDREMAPIIGGEARHLICWI